ncbi:MAG: TPM domain-containing protein [Novosphingobium sp.]
MMRPHGALARAVWHAVAVLFLLMAGAAQAAMPARPAGPVLDQANIIPDPEEAALAQKLSAYNAQTGRAVIVATVSSLDDLDVADYAQQLAENWDIGGAKTEQGVLFLVAPVERKVRIHSARGVQERLPDVLAGRIIRDVVAPKFKAGDYAGGITDGVDQIIAQLNRDPADAKAIAEAAKAASRGESRDSAGIGSAIFWVVLIVVLIGIFGRSKQGFAQQRSGIDPGIVLWGISEIARSASSNRHSGGWGGGGSDWSGGGGFGGFGGGGGGFDGGGASGDW